MICPKIQFSISKAGQDGTKEFGVLVKQLVPGDQMLIEGKYDLTAGPYEFPDDFVLEAVQHGGFTVLDSPNATSFLLYEM